MSEVPAVSRRFTYGGEGNHLSIHVGGQQFTVWRDRIVTVLCMMMPYYSFDKCYTTFCVGPDTYRICRIPLWLLLRLWQT